MSVTVFVILGSQIYRTVGNYQTNKQRYINDVQVALDLAVEKYYADKARDDIFVMMMSGNDTVSVSPFNRHQFFKEDNKLDSILKLAADTNTEKTNSQAFAFAWSNDTNQTSPPQTLKSKAINKKLDTLLNANRLSKIRVFNDAEDTSAEEPKKGFKSLTKKVMISISEDLIELGQLDKIVEEELKRKGIPIGYQLAHSGPDGNTTMGKRETNYTLSTTSKTTYLPRDETLHMHFENASMLILKKGLIDLVISLAIVLAVVIALWYLYGIIKEQKELALIKDDLISNITHEFKTPIATISTAIEAIANFNEANDQEKTKRYLGLSQDQLAKLNLMVEKLLETATIDSGMIKVNLEETDLVKLTQKVVDNYKIIAAKKSIALSIPAEEVWHSVDPFHIESALSNLIDNAIKYGGDQISVSLDAPNQRPVWKVADNGGFIRKEHKERIFEKLYRIPQGNQHDVKGFGIGLYYTKAVVEKHGGAVLLETQRNLTIFTIQL
ncbi:MAG: HAMP domain-containing sensor histidine kinase [Cyclobacteriaceae bacterium]